MVGQHFWTHETIEEIGIFLLLIKLHKTFRLNEHYRCSKKVLSIGMSGTYFHRRKTTHLQLLFSNPFLTKLFKWQNETKNFLLKLIGKRKCITKFYHSFAIASIFGHENMSIVFGLLSLGFLFSKKSCCELSNLLNVIVCWNFSILVVKMQSIDISH